MPIQIVTIQPTNVRIKALVYGIAGSGKTTLFRTANDHPALGETLFVDVDRGLISATGVKAIQVGNTADLDELYLALKRGSAEFARFQTIAIDSGTFYANKVLEEWVARGVNRKGGFKQHEGARTIDDVELQDYGKMTAQVRRIFSWFRDLDRHLLVSALQKDVYVGEGNNRQRVGIAPLFTDKLGDVCNGIFDCVWYLTSALGADGIVHRYLYPVKTVIPQGQGIPDLTIFAKTRGEAFGPALGAYVVDPSLPALYETYLASEGALYAQKGGTATR